MPLPYIGIFFTGSIALLAVAAGVLLLQDGHNSHSYHHHHRQERFYQRHNSQHQRSNYRPPNEPRTVTNEKPLTADNVRGQSEEQEDGAQSEYAAQEKNMVSHGTTTDVRVPQVSTLRQRRLLENESDLSQDAESIHMEYSYLMAMEQQNERKRQELLREQAQLERIEAELRAKRETLESQTHLRSLLDLSSSPAEANNMWSATSFPESSSSGTPPHSSIPTVNDVGSPSGSNSCSQRVTTTTPAAVVTTGHGDALEGSPVHSSSPMGLLVSPVVSEHSPAQGVDPQLLLSSAPRSSAFVSSRMSDISTIHTALEGSPSPSEFGSVPLSSVNPSATGSPRGTSMSGESWIELESRVSDTSHF
ncbi:hypothetical protein IWQ62_002161 [Dispira parvispora]|uniref:Uncharacterized protein n=1 Tax=Dispira parvispora TaxID=1520584 RepID=A0A9W8E449_9FUNG|nr:hypothetical protein IWQ62_002161 [Dispira parvispora]